MARKRGRSPEELARREKIREPQRIRKNQTSVSQGVENKILSMYAKGMTSPTRI